jgi:hypothetical protein
VAGLFYWLGIKRRRIFPEKIFSNEAIFFLGVLTTAGAIYQLGLSLDTGSGHFSLLVLLSAIVYGILGFVIESKLIWLFGLISLGSWMGVETGYASSWGSYYFGMSYPLRFFIFGTLMVGVALFLEHAPRFRFFFRATLGMGMLYLFMSLWLMSIFGNYAVTSGWGEKSSLELFIWSALFGAVACAAIFHGLRFENGMTKGFGITFLLINLYTRFFEYFWEHTHKAIFFTLLGLSFWYLGSRAEKIWYLGEQRKAE